VVPIKQFKGPIIPFLNTGTTWTPK